MLIVTKIIKMASKQEKAKKVWASLQLDEVMPAGVSAHILENGTLFVKGPKGEVSKILRYPKVEIKVVGQKIIVETKRLTQNEKKIMFTYVAHIKNLIKGVTEGFQYRLVVVYAKFPIGIEFKGQVFTVKNLLGEKVPRNYTVSNDVKVEIKAKEIFVSGIDKEKVGQAAASIEQLTRITHLDRRVIQDGIFITNKPHRAYI